jgi:hypothetical protein
MYAHEHVMFSNHGLRDERVIFTGQDVVFDTVAKAEKSAAEFHAHFGIKLNVYPFTEED